MVCSVSVWPDPAACHFPALVLPCSSTECNLPSPGKNYCGCNYCARQIMPDLPCPFRRPSRVGFRLGNPSLSLPLTVCSASPSLLPNHPFSQGNGLGSTGGV